MKTTSISDGRGGILEAVQARLADSPAKSTADVRVDRNGGKFGAGLIRGASIIETGPALGHGFDLDDIAVRQVVGLGNANSKMGVKTRFTHPDMCHDGLGYVLGRSFDYREAKDSSGQVRALADLHVLKAADRAKADHVMHLAEESPESLAISIVFSGPIVKRHDDNDEPLKDEVGNELPPVARVKGLYASDIVDEAAANTRGIFGDSDPVVEALSAFDAAFGWNAGAGVFLIAASEDRDEVLIENEDDIMGATEADAEAILVTLAAKRKELTRLLSRFVIGDLRSHLQLTSEDGASRAAAFMRRYFHKRGLSQVPISGAVIQRALRRSGPVEKGQTTMKEAIRLSADAGAGGGGDSTATGGDDQGGKPKDGDAKPADNAGGGKPDSGASPDLKTGALAERTRIREIQALAIAYPDVDLHKEIDHCVEKGLAIADAKSYLFDAMSKKEPNIETAGVDIRLTADEADKFSDVVSEAMLLRSGVLAATKFEGVELTKDFVATLRKREAEARRSGLAAFGPQKLAAKVLRKLGVRGVDDMSTEALFNAAFGINRRGLGIISHGTADFPAILANAGNKAMLIGWEGARTTWPIWTRRGNLNNYLTHQRIRLSEAALLEERPEGAAAVEMTMSDRQQSIIAKNYARAFSYTRQMFVNDDLGAFLTLGRRFGRGANNTIEYEVYKDLTSNSGVGPTMDYDSLALFHSTHANLNSSSAGAPNETRIDAMVQAMMIQSGIGEDGSKQPVGGPPVFFLAAPAVAVEIGTIINAPFRGTAGLEAPQDPDVRAARALKVPMLHQFSTTAWYGVADQDEAPSYEVAFIDGVDQPRTTVLGPTRIAGVEQVVDMDFGFGATGGHEGINRNAGV